jgi:porphobilinogen synthase
MTTASFPSIRMRRGRSSAWMRAMLAENRLHPSDFIWPLFICEGRDREEPVGSLPGVSRWSVDRIAGKAREAAELGIPCIALFPNTPEGLRSERAEEALNRDNLICRAIRAIKDAVPDIGVLTDVALDPYTAHGHDGLVDEAGYVLNDETTEILVGQALVQAEAGADIVAPSDMMDGRVGAIRAALEREGHRNVAIMAYAAKYASAFYGPFRAQRGRRIRKQGDAGDAERARLAGFLAQPVDRPARNAGQACDRFFPALPVGDEQRPDKVAGVQAMLREHVADPRGGPATPHPHRGKGSLGHGRPSSGE